MIKKAKEEMEKKERKRRKRSNCDLVVLFFFFFAVPPYIHKVAILNIALIYIYIHTQKPSHFKQLMDALIECETLLLHIFEILR